MKTILLNLLLFSSVSMLAEEGYKVGDKAADFKLKNTDGQYVSLSDFNNAKGFVVIFTCNHCPFAKAYEDRIITLDKEYKEKGFPVIAINPNDPEIVPEDSYDSMKVRAKEKGFTFPYLFDNKQEVYKKYGATRTPHVFLLKKTGDNLTVEYIGTIDDNYQDESAVKEKYLANAIDALIAGNKPDPDFTKAIGCTIKDKSKQ
ncbi:MAG: thioredoxin family protein [Bacteroidales bacterium]|nr:thioredoxin family protein [Bacteroidales bacterium]